MSRFDRFIAALLLAAPLSALAQNYPDKPVKLIVGFPPGGNVDLVGRLAAQKLAEGLGQQVVVENRTGAGSMIAIDAVAKAPADGYTLLLVSGAHVTLAVTQRKLPFDAVKSFAFISSIVTYPTILLVKPDSKIQSLADLIAEAKANPGKLNYPSPGVGTFYHLAGELMSSLAGVEMTHVPFRGGFEPVSELLAGRVDVLIDAVTQVWPNIQAGKLRPIAIASPERSAALPNVPLASQTVPGFDAVSFSGLAAPAGTPPAIIDRLNREVQKLVEAPDVKARFNNAGGNAIASTPEAFQKRVEDEIAKWKRVVETRRIELP